MNINTSKLNHLFTVGIFAIFLGPLSGTLRFWQVEGITISPAGSIITLFGLFLTLGSLFFCYKRHKTFPTISAWGCLICFLILFFSDWICRPYSLVKGPEIRGEIILGAMVFLLASKKFKPEKIFFSGLIFASISLLILFLQASKGNFIFSDDHSVVTYRLSLLKDNFPFIPFYNPLWNAGLDARDFFATGILNLFLIWAPLIYFFDVRDIYNLMVGGTIFIIAPWCTYLACRIDEKNKVTSAIAALLTLATSLFWYRWCLKYGSMGFVTSTIFIPLNFIILKRLVSGQFISNKIAILAIASISLMLCWSLTGIIMLPFLIFGIIFCRSLLKNIQIRKIAAWLLVINIPWILLFLSVSNVFSFITLQKQQAAVMASTAHQQTFSKSTVKGKVKALETKKIIEHAREYATPANALLLSFGFLGIFLIKDVFLRRWLFAFSGWLLLLGFVISPLKPQLELDRMLVVLGFILTIPAANVLGSLTEYLGKNKLQDLLISLPASYCLFAFLSVAAFFWQRTPEHFTFADQTYFQLGDSIKDNAGDGRAVFVGFVLHELNKGHLAPLMQQSGKPLVASSLYHNLWRYTELIPSSYLSKGEAGYEEYLSAINATLVIAHEKKWRDYFINKPNDYKFIGRYDVFNVFKRRNHISNYFFQGSGTVLEQSSNQVKFTTNNSSGVLAFNYFPFLETSDCKVYPYSVSSELTFIEFNECPTNKEIILKAKTGFRRLISDWQK